MLVSLCYRVGFVLCQTDRVPNVRSTQGSASRFMLQRHFFHRRGELGDGCIGVCEERQCREPRIMAFSRYGDEFESASWGENEDGAVEQGLCTCAARNRRVVSNIQDRLNRLGL